MFGATRIRIPPAGTENDDANPPRIAPHHLIDIGLGFDCLRLGAVPGAAVRHGRQSIKHGGAAPHAELGVRF
jgi:hypothetical protein